MTARPACLICRLGPVIRADAAVTQQYGFDTGAWQRPGGVAWDAVPLTVRGLNKAAGNPPFSEREGGGGRGGGGMRGTEGGGGGAKK